MFTALIVLALNTPAFETPRSPEMYSENLLCDEPEKAISVITQILDNEEGPVIPAGCSKQSISMSWVVGLSYSFTREPYKVSLVIIDVPNVGQRYSFDVTVIE